MREIRRRYKEVVIFSIDAISIIGCFLLSDVIRHNFHNIDDIWVYFLCLLPIIFFTKITCFYLLKLHKTIIRYSGIQDLNLIIKANCISLFFVIVFSLIKGFKFDTIILIDFVLLFLCMCATRYLLRIFLSFRKKKHEFHNNKINLKNILIVGAGDAGEMILRDILYNYKNIYNVIGIIDDDRQKVDRTVHGKKVLGNCRKMEKISQNFQIDEIIIAIPSLKPFQMRRIINYCISLNLNYRTLPNISEIISGHVKVKELREINLEDLLGREEILSDTMKISPKIKDRTVLITGAGGSIGSEIARQIAKLSPKNLILLDRAENPLYYIDLELAKYPNLKKTAVIADVCDDISINRIFAKYNIDFVFHAAAHKHVPLMESFPIEAIKNNVFGTYVVAKASFSHCVKRFVMLSTDKAVEPSSIMGATKKIAEMIINCFSLKESKTIFSAVRFGNVLGSEGSIVPTLKRQVEMGGPITITHKNIKRFFMTIPEAVSLVIESCFIARKGQILVLDMKEQIKIVDLAKYLVKLMGLQIHKDIKIKYIGLRPGEKMYEKLYSDDEYISKTSSDKIFIVSRKDDFCENFEKELQILKNLLNVSHKKHIISKIYKIINSDTKKKVGPKGVRV
jgi:FlaA1/EpsC-like NDP-sugar epimerase